MSQLKVGITRAAGLLKGPTALFSLGFVLLCAQAGQGQEPLTFFKNYFVTGDYAVRGTSLWRKGVNGVAKSDISISGVPEDNVDVEAAFL